MAKMPKEVLDALADPMAMKVLATVDESNTPNAVIIGTMAAMDEETVICAELKMGKTKENLLGNGKFTLNVTTNDLSSYQIKGKFKEQQQRTPLTEQWNEAVFSKVRMQIKGLFLGQVEEVYSASILKDAGKKLA